MPSDEAQYTRDELVDALRRLADAVGRSPTVADLKNATGYPPLRRFLDAFGTWNEAKQAADLETYRKEGRGKTYSRAELIERLQRLARVTEGFVTKRDVIDCEFCPSAVTYQRQFGSWNKAKEAAGLATVEADDTPVQYTDEELRELLRSLADDLDHPVTIHDVEHAEGYPGHATFERRFGSWNKAKEAAGLKQIQRGEGQRSNSYSDTELLQLLRDRANEIEGALTKAAMDGAPGYPASSTYSHRFGSWTKAKEAAGLETDDQGQQE